MLGSPVQQRSTTSPEKNNPFTPDLSALWTTVFLWSSCAQESRYSKSGLSGVDASDRNRSYRRQPTRTTHFRLETGFITCQIVESVPRADLPCEGCRYGIMLCRKTGSVIPLKRMRGREHPLQKPGTKLSLGFEPPGPLGSVNNQTGWREHIIDDTCSTCTSKLRRGGFRLYAFTRGRIVCSWTLDGKIVDQ